jgi:hypothetical protein
MPMISGGSCASGQTKNLCTSSTTLCKHRYCTHKHLIPQILPSVCAQWVLQVPTDDYEQQFMALLHKHLQCYQADGNAFIWWTLVVDEMQ